LASYSAASARAITDSPESDGRQVAHPEAPVLDRGPADRLADALAERRHPRRSRVQRDAEELLPTPPADDVLAANHAGDAARDGAEHRVAGLVPEPVVDGLEVVDVDERHAEGDAVAPGARDRPGEVPLERAAVVDARQHVRVGEPLELLIALGELLLQLLRERSRS
jgi:hypothetical protein